MSLAELSETVNVDPADLRVVLRWHEVDGRDLTREKLTAVHLYLNPNSERTVPELYYVDLGPLWRED